MRAIAAAGAVLLAAAGAWAGVGLAGPSASGPGKCFSRLVETLPIEMSSTTGVTSQALETGGTYEIYLQGGDFANQPPLLAVDGLNPGWRTPTVRPAIVVTTSPNGFSLGVGAGALGYVGLQQALARLKNPAVGTCYVDPASSWVKLPSSGGLTFTPFTRPADFLNPASPPDNRTLTLTIYQSVWVPDGEQPPTTTSNVTMPKYAFTFYGSSGLESPTLQPGETRRWVRISGLGAIPAAGAAGSGSLSGIYALNGTSTVRTAEFRISSSESAPSGGELQLDAEVTSSNYVSCPQVGDRLSITLLQKGAAGDSILLQGGCPDAFGAGTARQTARVSIAKVGG